MKKEDEIEKLFNHIGHQLDVYEPSDDHQVRFLEKLHQQNEVKSIVTKKRNWIKAVSIAASITLLIGLITVTSVFTPSEEADLASISPQMEETQNFFTVAIKNQLEEIQNSTSTETDKLVQDAMEQLKKLENNYQILKKDLVVSNNDSRVISAMITNFQKRATLLEDVLEKINNINTLKISENENNIL